MFIIYKANKMTTTKKSSRKSSKDKEIIDKNEAVKMLLLAKADANKGEQLSIMPDGDIKVKNEVQELLKDNSSIDDPEKKYNIYYKGIEYLLKKHLPKGRQFAKARVYIREEKKVLLTRGKRIKENGIRGADSRMGYIEDAQQILNIISSWVLKSGTMVDLYNELRDLNIKKGHGPRVVF